MSSFYNKKAGKSLSGMASVRSTMPGPKAIKSSQKKVDSGFYGHLEPQALKECDQVITSVTDVTGDE